MSPGKQYRTLAAASRARVQKADNTNLAAEWEHLAYCYDRLAEHADKNERFAPRSAAIGRGNVCQSDRKAEIRQPLTVRPASG